VSLHHSHLQIIVKTDCSKLVDVIKWTHLY
jgi:hypothetical protein